MGEICDLRKGCWQSERRRKFHAEMLILNALRQVDVGAHADLRLEDMRCGRAAMGNVPLVPPEKQRGFFLRAGNGYAELTFIGQPQRRFGQVGENCRYFFFGESSSLDLSNRARWSSFGQELKRADAIAAYDPKQAIGIIAFRLDTRRETFAGIFIIGEQIVEYSRYNSS